MIQTRQKFIFSLTSQPGWQGSSARTVLGARCPAGPHFLQVLLAASWAEHGGTSNAAGGGGERTGGEEETGKLCTSFAHNPSVTWLQGKAGNSL